MKFGVSSEQGSPKSRAAGLVAGHPSFICGELHHPSGLQGKQFVRFRIGFYSSCGGLEEPIWKRGGSISRWSIRIRIPCWNGFTRMARPSGTHHISGSPPPDSC